MQKKKKFITLLCCPNILGETISSLKNILGKHSIGKYFHLLDSFSIEFFTIVKKK
jgi:hypothetical protein